MSSQKRKRDVPVLFWVSADEMELIQQKMAQFGTKNLSAYLRKMAVDGYVVQLDLPELKELVSLLRRSSNNLNQLTRKVHETGRISQDNKAWAKTIPILEDSGASRHCAYLVVDGVNPGLTDLFTRQARKTMQEQQKSSVLQKLRQEPPVRKPAAPKKREPER